VKFGKPFPVTFNITLKTLITNLKIKRCGIVNRHNYIFMKQQKIHRSLILKLLIIVTLTYYCVHYITYIVSEQQIKLQTDFSIGISHIKK